METWEFRRIESQTTRGKKNTGNGSDGRTRRTRSTNLGEFSVREVFEQRTLAHGAVADQDQPKLIVKHGIHHDLRFAMTIGSLVFIPHFITIAQSQRISYVIE